MIIEFSKPCASLATLEGAIMRALMGLIVMIIVAGIGYWIYISNLKASGTNGAPAQAISTVGVKSDLLSLAQAERVYQANHGSYASLDELYSSGALAARKPGRTGYTYSSDTSAGGFTITARCQPQAAGAACPSYSIDQTMQVQQLP
jgi:hypothetical protein